jgi:hypothetical protein
LPCCKTQAKSGAFSPSKPPLYRRNTNNRSVFSRVLFGFPLKCFLGWPISRE